VDILVDVLKFVENLLKSGWVIVLGDSNYSIKYYSDVCGKLDPGSCLSIDISSGYLGFDVKLMFIKKSEKFRSLVNIPEKDFKDLYAVEVVHQGDVLKVLLRIDPDISRSINIFIESIERSIIYTVDRAKIFETARNLPHM
jgi:hypothetical protein